MTSPTRTESTDVVVIGGGIAGLVVAWQLARAGRRPLLLEAGAVVGGVLSSHRVGGLTLDAGAESFATTRPSVGELIDDLGLRAAVVRPSPAGAWVRHSSGTAPLPAGGLLGIPARPWAADVRRVVGAAGSARACLDRVLPRSSTEPSYATLGALVRSRMGRRVLDRLVEPVAGGVYAADPDQLEIQTIVPGLPAALSATRSLSAAVSRLRAGDARPGGAVASLTGGMYTLARALGAAVTNAGGTVRTDLSVTRLARAELAGSPGGIREGWQIPVPGGSTIVAGQVVLALPGDAAAALLAGAASDIPSSVLRPPATEVLLCTLVLHDTRLDRAPRGTGVLVSRTATGVRAKALTHATAKWAWLAGSAGPGRHVLRLSYGRSPDGGDLPAGAGLPDIALQDASTLLGLKLAPESVVDTAVLRWSSALPTPVPGHAAGVEALRVALAPRRLSVVGSAVAGTGLAAVVADARREAEALTAVLVSDPVAD